MSPSTLRVWLGGATHARRSTIPRCTTCPVAHTARATTTCARSLIRASTNGWTPRAAHRASKGQLHSAWKLRQAPRGHFVGNQKLMTRLIRRCQPSILEDTRAVSTPGALAAASQGRRSAVERGAAGGGDHRRHDSGFNVAVAPSTTPPLPPPPPPPRPPCPLRVRLATPTPGRQL